MEELEVVGSFAGVAVVEVGFVSEIELLDSIPAQLLAVGLR